MNQHTGDLKAAILAACKRPYGLATAEVPGYTAQQLGRMVQKLQSAGQVYRAKVGGKYGRYFDTEERAAEYAKTAVRKPKAKANDGKAAAFRGMVAQPTDIKPTKIASKLRDRFAVDDVPPFFSSLRPGQYIAPAPVWLQGVAA